MSIDYTKVIRNSVEPKLAYHGFKYDEKHSYPPQGSYSFRRTYWGKSQYVNIGRAEYDAGELAGLLAEGEDIPTEVPREQLLIKEPGHRLWLSNRFLTVVIGHEAGGIDLTRTGIGIPAVPELPTDLPFTEALPIIKKVYKEHVWWKFRNEAELREVLNDVVEIFLRDGLDWLERQVAEIRRYHEKLDARRLAEKARRNE